MLDYDVVVVGAGVVGCCAALSMAERGLKVLVVERFRVGSGTTWHSGGLVRGYDVDPDVHPLMVKSWARYRQLGEEHRRLPLWAGSTGGLTLARTADGADTLRRTAEALRGRGLACEELSPAAVETRWPDMSADGVRCGLFVEREGRVNPLPLCVAAATSATRLGAQFRSGTEVEDVRMEGGSVVVELRGGRSVLCGHCVLATGMWGGQLTGLPVVAVHEQYVVPAHRFAVDIPVVKDIDAYLWGGVFNPNGRVLLGSLTRDEKAVPLDDVTKPFARLPFIWHAGRSEEDPAERPLVADPPPLEALARKPKQDTQSVVEGLSRWLFPALRDNRRLFSTLAGAEGNTPDLLPLIGPVQPGSRIIAAFGFSGHGIQMAGGAGELLTDAVAAGGGIPAKLSATRFGRRYRGDPCGLVRDVEEAHSAAHPSARKNPAAKL